MCNIHVNNDFFFLTDQCRKLQFGTEKTFEGKRLVNHVLRVHDVMLANFCDVLCYMEHNCASYNMMRGSETEGHKCELNNSTHEGNENDLEENPDYLYRGIKATMKLEKNLIIKG